MRGEGVHNMRCPSRRNCRAASLLPQWHVTWRLDNQLCHLARDNLSTSCQGAAARPILGHTNSPAALHRKQIIFLFETGGVSNPVSLRSSQFGFGAVGNYANTGTARAHLNNSLAVFLPCHLSYSLLATPSSPRLSQCPTSLKM